MEKRNPIVAPFHRLNMGVIHVYQCRATCIPMNHLFVMMVTFACADGSQDDGLSEDNWVCNCPTAIGFATAK